MIPFQEQVQAAIRLLIQNFNPQRIVLFGSVSKGCARIDSDIDLCVVLPCVDKKVMGMNMQLELCKVIDRDIDLLILTPDEWECNKDNPATFTGLIQRTGVVLHG